MKPSRRWHQPARFTDRAAAGRLLAKRVKALRLRDPVVYALPRGGVPVAVEVAAAPDGAFSM